MDSENAHVKVVFKNKRGKVQNPKVFCFEIPTIPTKNGTWVGKMVDTNACLVSDTGVEVLLRLLVLGAVRLVLLTGSLLFSC